MKKKTNFAILGVILIAITVYCYKYCFEDAHSEKCCLLPLCEPYQCPPLGYTYVPGELVISYPLGDTTNALEDVETTLINYYGRRLGLTLEDEDLIDIEIDTCICNLNLFKIFDSLIIGHETGLAQMRNGTGEGEGTKWSTNFVVEDSYDNPPLNKERPFSHFLDPVDPLNSDSMAVVAILDSGVDGDVLQGYRTSLSMNLPQVTNVQPYGINVMDKRLDGRDVNGHGTAVGKILIETLNALDPLGLELNVKIVPINVLDGCGRGTVFTVACGLYCADSIGAVVTNMSLGAYQESVQFERAFSEVTVDGSMYICASSGNKSKNLNTNTSIHVPSMYATKINLSNGIDMSHVSDYVLEVGGLCVDVRNMCNVDSRTLWIGSNYRNEMFVAPSIGLKGFADDISNPDCIVPGTSYAAPQIAAALISTLNGNSGNLSSNFKSLLKNSGIVYSNYHLPSDTYTSYIYTNCEN